MFFNRTKMMTAMLVLMALGKAQLAMAGGNGNFHVSKQNQTVHMHQPTFVPKGLTQTTNFTPQFTKSQPLLNPQVLGTQQVNKFPGTLNQGLGKGTPITLPQSSLGNIGLGKGKPLPLPQIGNNIGKVNPILANLPNGLGKNNGGGLNINPILNGKFPGPIQKKPQNPGILGGGFNFPVGPIKTKPFYPITPFPVKNWCGWPGCGYPYPSWSCGWPNYGYRVWGCGNFGCYPPIYGFNFPVVQTYPLPISTPTYVTTTTPQVIEVQPASTTVVVQDPQSATPPAPAALTEIDPAITDVRLVDAGTMTTGPQYRITVMNKGPNDMNATTRMAVVSMKATATDQEPPHQIATVRMLKVNDSMELNVQMPVTSKDFPLLMVAVEVPANFKDMNEQNNVAQGEAAQIPVLATIMK